MKANIFPCLAMVVSISFLVASATSCMTTYDANGNPVQSVDPGAAAAGVVAAGVLGYAIADNHNHNDNYYHGGGHYHGGGYYRGGSYYRGGGGRYGGHYGGRHR